MAVRICTGCTVLRKEPWKAVRLCYYGMTRWHGAAHALYITISDAHKKHKTKKHKHLLVKNAKYTKGKYTLRYLRRSRTNRAFNRE